MFAESSNITINGGEFTSVAGDYNFHAQARSNTLNDAVHAIVVQAGGNCVIHGDLHNLHICCHYHSISSTASHSTQGTERTTPERLGTTPSLYTPPTRFKIGSMITAEPLVPDRQIKGHLALLHEFSILRNTLEETDISVPHVETLDKERKWAWFVGLAVERFDRWCQKINPSDMMNDANVVMPPVDVVMVWHSYKLNPGWYLEDSMRIPACKNLKFRDDVFLQILEDPSLSHLLFSDPPSEERRQLWESRTSLPFSPFDRVGSFDETVISCPRCSQPIRVALMTADGRGYLQQNFATTCNNKGCSSGAINKQSLAFAKLVKDLCIFPSLEYSSYLPGTLFPSSPANADRCNRLKQVLYDSPKMRGIKEPDINLFASGYENKMIQAMMTTLDQSLSSTRTQMMRHIGPRFPCAGILGPPWDIRTPRIMSAYSDNKIYSVELVGAVLRQGNFVQKMFDLGWTRRGYFDAHEDELALCHATARYHAFLDLMSSSVSSLFVPTLDIDLVWHTHQLMSAKYNADCALYLGRFIDHDDKIEGLHLSSAFDMTCTAWRERFNVEYTSCGCPLPGDTIGKRISRVISIHSESPPAPASHLLPINRLDFPAATHASDHNAVRFRPAGIRARVRMTKRYEHLARTKDRERQKTMKKAAKKGVAPYANTDKRKDYTSDGYAHQAAFLAPLPLYYDPINMGPAACVGAGTVVTVAGGCTSVY